MNIIDPLKKPKVVFIGYYIGKKALFAKGFNKK